MKHLTIIFIFLPIYLLGQSDLDTKMAAQAKMDSSRINILEPQWILSGGRSYIDWMDYHYANLGYSDDVYELPQRILINPSSSTVGITGGYFESVFISDVTLVDSATILFCLDMYTVVSDYMCCRRVDHQGYKTDGGDYLSLPDMHYFIRYNVLEDSIENQYINFFGGLRNQKVHFTNSSVKILGVIEDTLGSPVRAGYRLPYYLGSQVLGGSFDGQFRSMKKLGSKQFSIPKDGVYDMYNHRDTIINIINFDNAGLYTLTEVYDFYWVNSLTEKGHYKNPLKTCILASHYWGGSKYWEVEDKRLYGAVGAADDKGIYILRPDLQLLYYTYEGLEQYTDLSAMMPHYFNDGYINTSSIAVTKDAVYLSYVTKQIDDYAYNCMKLDKTGKHLWTKTLNAERHNKHNIKIIDGDVHWVMNEGWSEEKELLNEKIQTAYESGFWYEAYYWGNLYTILDGQTGEIKWGGYLPLKGEAPLGKVADGRILVPSMSGWMLFRPNMEE